MIVILVISAAIGARFGLTNAGIGIGSGVILAVLATDRVPRLRLGVGRGPAGVETADHVLARPEGAEALALEKAVAEGALAVISWLDCPSIQIAMNLVNRPPPEDPSGEGPAG